MIFLVTKRMYNIQVNEETKKLYGLCFSCRYPPLIFITHLGYDIKFGNLQKMNKLLSSDPSEYQHLPSDNTTKEKSRSQKSRKLKEVAFYFTFFTLQYFPYNRPIMK